MPELKEPTLPDPAEVTRALTAIGERSQRLISEFLEKQAVASKTPNNPDPLNIGHAFLDLTTRLMADPAKLMEAQWSLWQDYVALWQNTTKRFLGGDSTPSLIEPEKHDKRFKDDAWQQNEVFDYIKQSYLLTSRWITQVVDGVEGLDDKSAQKVDFYVRQFVDAMSPSNFALTNPEVLRTTVETGGENLLKGLENLLSDLEKGRGQLRISMTDESAFKVGENVAVTPGQVVFQNELMQLIQYTPTTPSVASVPVVIVPPWINKYYILDLRAKNSLVKWLTDQGLTTFIISWVNPDASLRNESFEDYMIKGPLAAFAAAREQTGSADVNTIGYCLGGTLLATTLAYLAAKGEGGVKSATLMATLTDFSDPGEIGVFIDGEQLKALDENMAEQGYLDGSDMATSFNMLRSNDLIWSFVVSNYLLGKEPFPFDLLYWNTDSTRMPAAMHSFYLHNMYEKNRLVEPGGISVAGVPIDLRAITVPIYMLSTREDHIAPWKATYKATQLYAGKVRFVLAGSGHIAGVVNPPAANKYCYWTNTRKAKTADAWFKNTTQTEGSWWVDWLDWLSPYKGESTPARNPLTGPLKPIEAAPGQYVSKRD